MVSQQKTLMILLVFLTWTNPRDAEACRALLPTSERLKKTSEVVFKGRLQSYSLKNHIAFAIYKTMKTIRAIHRDAWTVKIKPNVNWSPPKSQDKFIKCFGHINIVGIEKLGRSISVFANQDNCIPPHLLKEDGSQMVICAGMNE
ncbi:MAG: hypothetical protein HRU19_25125 [Pseudobacteriovorax sp.]|nr:hypothetical protein [Pseudobacteriovorax sp.]